MVFTIHRYIFRELFRVFTLATIALTLMFTLGSMLRPIQKYGVGPDQVVHLLGYFIPITLTMVLPMSALFAASMVYGRFAGDRELDACRASGISLTTLVYPGLCLAIMVSIATLILSFHVVPAFVQRAEKAIKANAKQTMFRNIQRQGYYAIPESGYIIYADRALPEEDMLEGVVIVESKNAGITKLSTAKAAKIVIESHKNYNEVRLTASQAYQIDNDKHVTFGKASVTHQFDSLLADNIKFKKIEQIKEIIRDPMEYFPVRKLALKMRAQLAAEMLAQDISTAMAQPDRYYELIGEDKTIFLSAGECVVASGPEWQVQLNAPVRLVEIDTVLQKPMYQYDSSEGTITLQDSAIDTKLELVLDKPQWQDLDEGITGFAQRYVIKDLALPEVIASRIGRQDLLETLDVAESMVDTPTGSLKGLRSGLLYRIESTINEINAEMHSRLVLGVGCLTLILTGIALGVIFRGGHLLTAFGASSIPAGILIVCIMTGKELTKNRATSMESGIMVMWIGLAALSVITLVIYRKLLKT